MTQSTATLGQYLAQLTLGVGDERLPPERELALHLDMSRQALREGMTHFVAKGAIRKVHGVGSFVSSDLSLMRIVAPGPASDRDLGEARRLLQPDIAALAAARASKVHLEALADSVQTMLESLDNQRAFHAVYHCFHQILLEATCNPLLGMLLRWGSPEPSCACLAGSGDLLRLLDIHRDLYRAVRAGKPDMAKFLLQSLSVSESDTPAKGKDISRIVTMCNPSGRRSKAPMVDWPVLAIAGGQLRNSMR